VKHAKHHQIENEELYRSRNDAMAHVLWTRHLLAPQGMYLLSTTIHQDNKSTVLLAENGKYEAANVFGI